MIRKRRLTETQAQEKTERAQAAEAGFKYRVWTNRKAGMSFEGKQTKRLHLPGVTWSKRVVSEAVKFPFQMSSIRQRCRLLFPNFNFTLAQAVKTFLTQLRAETAIVSLGGALRQRGSHNDSGDLSLLLRMIVAGEIQETHSQQNPQGNHFLLQGAMSDFSPLEAATEHSTYPKTKNMELVPFTSDWVSYFCPYLSVCGCQNLRLFALTGHSCSL